MTDPLTDPADAAARESAKYDAAQIVGAMVLWHSVDHDLNAQRLQSLTAWVEAILLQHYHKGMHDGLDRLIERLYSEFPHLKA